MAEHSMQQPPKLSALEEDDEFEEFAAEGCFTVL